MASLSTMSLSRVSRRASLITALVVALFAPPASAEPMLSSLDTVLSQPNIVIGVYLGAMRLSITRALRGNLRGTVTVLPGDGSVALAPNTTVVAFLDRQRAFRYYAAVPRGMTVATAPLWVHGFYDFNAHIVSPGLLTLRSLEARLAGQPGDLHLRGPIMALDAQGAITQTSMTVDVLAPERGRTEVTGLPSTAGLPAPSALLGGIHDEASVVWSTGYPRPFALHATIESVDASGVLVTRFHVTSPEYLFRERDIRAYLSDDDHAYPLWSFRVRFSDRAQTAWSGTIGEDYNGSPRFRDASGREQRWSSFSLRNQRYIEFAGERWELDPAPSTPLLDTYGDARVFVQELHRGPLGFRVSSGPRAGLRGQIELGALQLRPAIRAR
ncbi:MAG: hypothetical protein JNK05_35495 [Myxococcales bacterium]|nr:hypothetical protein [Myxococcales bacterium]